MRLVWFVVALAACQAAEERRNVLPGGDDDESVTPGGGDASVPDGTAGDGAAIMGRVCLLADLRNLEGCASSGADGLMVTLGTQVATTAADGTFTMPAPSGSTLVWRVVGTGVVPSRMVFSAFPLIPVVPQTLYDDLLIANGVILNAGQGSVVARVVSQGLGVPGVTGTIVTANQSFYDGSSASTWNQNSTGNQGVIWIPAVPTGSANLTLAVAGSMTSVPVDVDEGGITFTIVPAS